MNLSQNLTKGAMWNAAGFLYRFAIGFISSIIFVRLLGQYQYGIVTFILSAVFFTGIFVNLGFGTVMTQVIAKNRAEDKGTDIGGLLKQITWPRIIVLMFISIVFFQADLIAPLLNQPAVGDYLIFIPLIIFTTYFHGTLASLLICFFELKTVSIASMLEITVKLIFVTIAIYLGYAVLGFFIVILFSQAISGIILLFRSKNILKREGRNKTIPFRLKNHLKLAFQSYLVAISIRLLGREVDLFLIGVLHHDIREVAIYAVVFGLPKMVFDIFNHLTGGGLGLNTFTEMVKADRRHDLKKQYQSLLHLFSIGVFPAITGGIIIGGDMIHVMYGEAYTNLHLPISILFIAIGLSSLNSVTGDMLYALNKGKTLMYLHLSIGLMNVIVNLMLISKFGALGVAITTGIALLILTIAEMTLIHRELNPEYPLKDWSRYLLISITMALTIMFLPLPFYLKILIGVLVYCGLVYWIETVFEKRRNLILLINLIKAAR